MTSFRYRFPIIVVIAAALLSYSAFSSHGGRVEHLPHSITVRGSLFPSGFVVQSASQDKVNISLSIPECVVRPRVVRGTRDDIVLLKGAERVTDFATPVFRQLIAIPDGGEVSVTSVARKTVAVRDIEIAGEKTRRRFLDGGQSRALVTVEYVGYLREQRLVSIRVSPALYEEHTRTLTVATDMEITLAIANSKGPVTRDVGPMGSVLSGVALNFDRESTPVVQPSLRPGTRETLTGGGQVCWCTGTSWQEAATSAATCGADYLIIVADSLATSPFVDSLALHRASYNGFNVAIALVSQVDASPDTVNTPVAIRSLIDSVYTSQTAAHMGDGRLGYVLLLGDAYDATDSPLLPSYYGYANHGITPTSSNDFFRAADSYYSFLDANPSTDRFPDVLIGRLPVDQDASDWEIANLVRKIVRYEPLPVSAWTDSVVMVSGTDDRDFTFEGEGLSGFQSFFDSVSAYYGPPDKSIIQLHRLALSSPSDTSKHRVFGNKLAASMKRGKWLTAFFDHGSPFYWVGSFYARSYETFGNTTAKPTVVFSIGSNTSQFDLTANWGSTVLGSCSVGQGCMVAPPSSIQCESPGYQSLDKCDVIAERLLVQPGGAVAVVGYSRTQLAPDAQADFTNLFRSLSDQNPSTLGELLVGARMFRLSSDVTARNLMLLGDPALDIRTRAPAAPDTFDVAIGTQDIRSPWSTYLHDTSSPVTLTVRNTWRTDVVNLEVELWSGEPEGAESDLLSSTVIDTLAAYGEEVVEFTVSTSGNVELFARLDPDDDLAERAEDNNVASRRFLALPYKGDYPMRLGYNGNRSIVIADLEAAAGKEFLVCGGSESNQVMRCFAVSDTTPSWSFATGAFSTFIQNTPVVGNVFKSPTTFVAVESGVPTSSVRLLSGESGAVVTTRAIGDSQFADRGVVKWLLTDLGPDDNAMELVTLKYRTQGILDTLFLQALRPTGAIISPQVVDVNTSLSPATIAVADINVNGSKEVILLSKSVDDGNELKVYSFASSTFSLSWERNVSDLAPTQAPSIVLFDSERNGTVEVLCNGRSNTGTFLRLYDSLGSAIWPSDLSVTTTHTFSAGDIDADGVVEVVVADHEQIRIIASDDGSVLDTKALTGDPVSVPYLVDLDGDGDLDIVALFQAPHSTDNFFPQPVVTYLNVLSSTLDELDPVRKFQSLAGASSSALPAIDDLDDDGQYEVVYASPDGYLHVFELGTAAGNAAWPQRFGNALQTGLDEQPIVGDDYVSPMSLYQKTRMLGHVVLDSVLAPSFYVGHGTSVLIDTSTVEGYELRAYGSVRVKGSSNAPVTFRTEPAAVSQSTWAGLYIDDRSAASNDPDSLLYLTLTDAWIGVNVRSPLYVGTTAISNTFDTGLETSDWLEIRDSELVNSEGRGLYVGPGGDAAIVATRIEYHEGNGLTCVDCGLVVSSGSSMSYNGLHGVYMVEPSGSSLSSSVIQHNAGDGIRVEDGSPTISACLLRNNDIALSCWYEADPVMTYSRADSNGVGISGVYDSYPMLGTEDNPGHNCILATTAHHVINLNGGVTPIYTQVNNYGSNCCKPSKFSGAVVCQPCDAAPECTEPSGMTLIVADFSKAAQEFPGHFELGPGYPNPFNPSVTVPYYVPTPGGTIQIVVYNVLGQRVVTLVSGHKGPGRHFVTWNGRDQTGSETASGVYFVRMTAPQFTSTKKIVLLK